MTAVVATLNYTSTLRLVNEALARGETAVNIVRATQAGLRVVGERYERQEIFPSGLIMAGEIFRGVMEIVQADWESGLEGGASGRVLLGTVLGDIHDLGKNMAALRTKGPGYRSPVCRAIASTRSASSGARS